MTALSESQLLKSLNADRKDNSNSLLVALMDSEVVFDPCNASQSIMERAQQLWSAGPSVPTLGEQRELMYVMRKILGKATRWGASDNSFPPITSLECSLLFYKLVLAHCRSQRLWTAMPRAMASWQDPRYSNIKDALQTFASLHSINLQVDYLYHFAKECLAMVHGGSEPLTCRGVAVKESGASDGGVADA
jgi:hypothetical protein